MFGANSIVYLRLQLLVFTRCQRNSITSHLCPFSAINTGVKRLGKCEVMPSVFMAFTRIRFPCVDQSYTRPNHNNVTVTDTCCSSFVSIALPPIFRVATSASDFYAPPSPSSLEF